MARLRPHCREHGFQLAAEWQDRRDQAGRLTRAAVFETMTFITTLLLAAALQAAPSDRSRAEALAREGHTVEAIEIFTRIAAANPADVDARLWLARLALRLGRVEDAHAGFRAVLDEHPGDNDARIGLGMVLTRMGDWRAALDVLRAAERTAGENADLYSALARAHRRAGNDELAIDYFARAKALAPADPDVVLGYEAVARAFGHWIAVDGLKQWAAGETVGAGSMAASVRVLSRLHVQAEGRVQRGPGYSDAIGGGGALWRSSRASTVSFRVVGGSTNVALPTSDVSGEMRHYGTPFETGLNVRRLTFADADLFALSPLVAWVPNDLWRVDVRYTFSHSAFHASGERTGDHSILLRPTWQGWPRVAFQGTYAYGIESFEDLTSARLASLGATTAAAGARVDLRSLTRITATWEHQWRSNDTRVDRFTVSLVQSIR